MKRITNACLEQTLLFTLKERISPEADGETVRQEYEHYKKQMEHKRMRYTILSEETQTDGALRVKIKRQYNNYPCEQYFS